MKIPKYIREAIFLRAKYAQLFNDRDRIVSEWCDKNGIQCEFTHHNLETVVDPLYAAEETLEILEKA